MLDFEQLFITVCLIKHDDTTPMSLVELRSSIEAHFNKSELEDLAFRLDIKYDNLRGETLRDKARELVSVVENIVK